MICWHAGPLSASIVKRSQDWTWRRIWSRHRDCGRRIGLRPARRLRRILGQKKSAIPFLLPYNWMDWVSDIFRSIEPYWLSFSPESYEHSNQQALAMLQRTKLVAPRRHREARFSDAVQTTSLTSWCAIRHHQWRCKNRSQTQTQKRTVADSPWEDSSDPCLFRTKRSWQLVLLHLEYVLQTSVHCK